MTRSYRAAPCAALMAALLMSGCTDFLTGDGVTSSPNSPTQATRDQLFVAVQSAQFAQQTGSVAFLGCMYMQQCSGVGGRFVETWDNYGTLPQDLNADFIQGYTGGGLVDIRDIRARSVALGDKQYEGIAKVWEAITASYLADNWGDIPYRQAAGAAEFPEFDPQMQVYSDLQLLLDEAIADLAGAGPGPGAVDLVYGGNVTKWTQAAHTLKARLHMHTAEVLGNAAYSAAIAAAANGISSPANDFRTFQTTATSERNIWNQFYGTSFGGDIVAGKRLVDIMAARNDPRLDDYFGLSPAGTYGGNDVNGVTPSSTISRLDGERNVPAFRQPVLTWDENQLILAEARFQVAGGGAAGTVAAQANLDAVRSQYIATPTPATLVNIMTEKYIAMFQNIEVWQDYKRTCLPVLTPAAGATHIPGRVYYGTTESSANPNTPPVSSQLANGGVAHGRPGVGGFRNPNDPNPCPAP